MTKRAITVLFNRVYSEQRYGMMGEKAWYDGSKGFICREQMPHLSLFALAQKGLRL